MNVDKILRKLKERADAAALAALGNLRPFDLLRSLKDRPHDRMRITEDASRPRSYQCRACGVLTLPATTFQKSADYVARAMEMENVQRVACCDMCCEKDHGEGMTT